MLNVVIIGASGYAGAELAAMVQKHPHLTLKGLYVSAGSQDANKPFSALHPRFLGLVNLPVKPLNEEGMAEAKAGTDLVCLATAHEVSMDLAPQFLAAGIKVFDLNEITDLPVYPLVGFFVAPADAQPSVLRQADLVLKHKGGCGAIRELTDQLLGILN